MDLKGKLGTLTRPLGLAPSPEGPRPEVLDALRVRMQRILRQSPAPAPPARAPLPSADTSDLPFAVEPANQGVLWRRQQILKPSTHVGRMPLEAARDACPKMLGLLSLEPKLGECDLRRALFLDTETTGLGGSGSVAFLIGLAWFNAEGKLVLEQLLLRSPEDEPAMLRHLALRLARSSLLVTYNGKAFDIPLLMGRFVMNRLAEPPDLPHLDLLHVARRLHKARLGQCRLVSLESGVLGFERGDDIGGSEIPPLYAHYLRTGQAGVLGPIVEHNAWDVMSMAALMGLYGEPLGALHVDDLVGLARTLKRAGALEEAVRVADRAVRSGAGPGALLLRGQLAKARGDKNRALADFEALSDAVDDAGVRLELAKLYEHHVKAPLKALGMVERGTGERPELIKKRRERLLRKHQKHMRKSIVI